MDKKVSVLIPIYNAEKYLTRCISSVIEQSYTNIEIILVDDGSKDKSLSICKRLSQRDNRIRFIKQENSGVSSARNKAIENATGEFITFLDADDSLGKDYIKKLIEQHENYVLTRCRNDSIKENILSQKSYVEKIASGEIKGVCWGYLFERKILNELRFDENTSYMEDTIFIIQYILRIKKVRIVNDAIYNYYKNNDSLTQKSSDVSKRIHGYSYSIDEIEKILKNTDYNYDILLNKRKIKLFESEIAKIQSKQQLIEVLNETDFATTVNTNDVNFIYKIIIYLIKKKKTQVLFLYIKLRNLIKACLRKEK